MKELIEQINKKYEEIKNIILSQKEMIDDLKKEINVVKKENATLTGQLVEVNGRWNKLKGLLKKVNEGGME